MSSHRGAIGSVPLPEVFRDLYFDRVDGVLAVTGAGRQSEIYFDRGAPFYCKADAPEQRLDRVLVRWGLVHPEAVGALMERAGRDIRGALVREGVFPDAKAFDEFMASVLRERMMDVFVLREGAYEFQPQDVRALNQTPFPTSPGDVVLEGVRRLPDDAVLAPLLADPAHVVANERPSVPLGSLHLSPSEGYVLAQLNGTMTVAEIAAVSPLGTPQTLRLVYALLLLDIVRHPSFEGYRFSLGDLVRRSAAEKAREEEERRRIEEEYMRVRAASAQDVVPGAKGLAREALREAVKAYQEAWKPERFSERVAREMRDRLLIIAGRAGEALLSGVDTGRKAKLVVEEPREDAPGEEGEDAFRLKRMEFSKSETQEKVEHQVQRAAEYFKRAQEAYRVKDFHVAVQMLREAIRHNETAEYQAALAEALAQNPHWGKKAEEAYLRAMALDQFNPWLPLALGRIYERAGLKARAKEQYERCLEIQKDFEEAKAALKSLRK